MKISEFTERTGITPTAKTHEKETIPYMIYGYTVMVSNENRTYFHVKTFGRLSNAQKWGNRFRGVGSTVKIFFDSIKIMQKHNTQKF